MNMKKGDHSHVMGCRTKMVRQFYFIKLYSIKYKYIPYRIDCEMILSYNYFYNLLFIT